MAETKLAIFDLDGVLIDSKEIHFLALNEALKSVDSKYVISESDHATKYDGLSTSKN
jgi:beta-phosphoglucomutase-like phosphatase (HAD superfamily)